ncbi:hypothetical protein AAMO2058_001325400 [Amorphochlora amoebiformis]
MERICPHRYSDQLQYFRKSGSSDPVGTLKLRDVSDVNHYEAKRGGRRFDITLSGTKRKFCLLATDRSEAERWVKALRVAVQSQAVENSGRAKQRRGSLPGKFWKSKANTLDVNKRLSAPLLQSSVGQILNSMKKIHAIDTTLRENLHPRGIFYADETEKVLLTAVESKTGRELVYLLHCIRTSTALEEKNGCILVPRDLKDMIRGFEKMEMLQNPFLMRCVENGETKSQKVGRVHWILYEFPGTRTLLSLIRELGRLHHRAIFSIGLELATLVACMHKEGIALRALRTGTVHIRPNGHVCVCDPWMAMPFERAPSAVTPNEYQPPEALRHDVDIDERPGDWWRLGILLYECAVGMPPFLELKDEKLLAMMSDKKALQFPSSVPGKLQDIIRLLLSPDVQTRSQDVKLFEQVTELSKERFSLDDQLLNPSRGFDVLEHCMLTEKIGPVENRYSMFVQLFRGEGFGPLAMGSLENGIGSAYASKEDKKKHKSKTMGKKTKDEFTITCEINHSGQTAKAQSHGSVATPVFDTQCQFNKTNLLNPLSIKVFVGKTRSRRASVTWTCVGMVHIHLEDIVRRMSSRGHKAVADWYEVIGPSLSPAGRLMMSVSLHEKVDMDKVAVNVSTKLIDQAYSGQRYEMHASMGTITIEDEDEAPVFDIRVMRGEKVSPQAKVKSPFKLQNMCDFLEVISWTSRETPCDWAKVHGLRAGDEKYRIYGLVPSVTEIPSKLSIHRLPITFTEHGIPTFQQLATFSWNAHQHIQNGGKVTLICDTSKRWADCFIAGYLVISRQCSSASNAVAYLESKNGKNHSKLSASQIRYVRYVEDLVQNRRKGGYQMNSFCWTGFRWCLRYVRISNAPSTLRDFTFNVIGPGEILYDHLATTEDIRASRGDRKKGVLETPCCVYLKGDINLQFFNTKIKSGKQGIPLFSFCFHTSCVEAEYNEECTLLRVKTVDSKSEHFLSQIESNFQIELFLTSSNGY